MDSKFATINSFNIFLKMLIFLIYLLNNNKVVIFKNLLFVEMIISKLFNYLINMCQSYQSTIIGGISPGQKWWWTVLEKINHVVNGKA
jgi:hypothetical protein